jgi:hypothetical protein
MVKYPFVVGCAKTEFMFYFIERIAYGRGDFKPLKAAKMRRFSAGSGNVAES